MKFYVAILASILCLNCSKTESSTSLPDKYYPDRDPKADLQTAIQVASKSNKRILLKVGGEWCIWCHRLDDFIEAHEEIDKALHKNFVVLKINFSPENKNEEFLSQYPKIAGYPHIFVLDSDGTFLYSQNTGDLESGKSYDKDKLMNFIETWKPNT